MDKQLREQLKHDKFVEEVGQTVEYLSEHKAAVRKYALLGGVAVLVVAGVWLFMGWQKSARQEAYSKALAVKEASVGADSVNGETPEFKTEADKQAAVLKALGEVSAKYSGSREGLMAQLESASILCDQGKEAECEKMLQQVSNGGDSEVASLGKFSLATLYNAQGKAAQAEEVLRQLVANPTALVSKEQAQIALARTIGPTKRDEAKKLLEGLQSSTRSPVARAAVTAMGELTATK